MYVHGDCLYSHFRGKNESGGGTEFNLLLPDVPRDNEEIERIVSGDLYYGILKGPVYLGAPGWAPLAIF